MRRRLVAGNWKMHGDLTANQSLVEGIMASGSLGGVDVLLCPPHVYLPQVAALCANSPLHTGAQDCSHLSSGAYTGEVAPPMLREIGCSHVIIGHSERRQYHGEAEALLAAKVAAAVSAGLAPILCVGETREQREAGEAEAVVAAQLDGALNDQADLAGLVIAYEPVWAIGTGLTATPAEAQAMHAFIRGRVAAAGWVDADALLILYGGSVKADNAATLFAEVDIDGALVGGASLDAAAFNAIIDAARHDAAHQ